jgi:Ca2+-binding RTX toxin-like protein
MLAGVAGGRPAGGGYPTEGADALDGTSAANVMAGLGGNDHLYGHGGNDTMTGGAGTDRMAGGTGDDLMAGGAGADLVDGGEGNDTIVWRPGEGNDHLRGGNGQDVLKLELTGLTLEQVRDAITLDDGSRPQIMDGQLTLNGGSGTLTIGGETIRFDGFEAVRLSDTSPYMYGR